MPTLTELLMVVNFRLITNTENYKENAVGPLHKQKLKVQRNDLEILLKYKSRAPLLEDLGHMEPGPQMYFYRSCWPTGALLEPKAKITTIAVLRKIM